MNQLRRQEDFVRKLKIFFISMIWAPYSKNRLMAGDFG